jgi:hypothetical protein
VSWSIELACDDLPKMHLARLSQVTVGFSIEDHDLQIAIRTRDPKILDALNWALDKYEEIAALMDLRDSICLDWMRRTDPSEFERKVRLALQSEYADDLDRQQLQGMLDALKQERRKQKTHRVKSSLIAKRRTMFHGRQPELMLALIDRDGYECEQCGSQDDLTIDHIIPLSRGGSDDLDNLHLLCRACNSRKGDH